VDEIASDVDETSHAKYFEQASNGVTVRMALLDLALGGDGIFAEDGARSLAEWDDEDKRDERERNGGNQGDEREEER
jgi:hypothetical protein